MQKDLPAVTDAEGPFNTARQRAGLGALLLAAMGAAMVTVSSVGILATFLIEDYGITRAQLGFVLAAMTLGGAVMSPAIGRVTDVIGGRNALVAVFVLAAGTFMLTAASPVYLTLFLPALVSGAAQAFGNPATNKLIVSHLPRGSRGVITGVKQSGVQAAIFIGGLVLPSAAIALGWRATMVISGVLPLALIPVVYRLLPADRPDRAVQERATKVSLPPAIRWLAVYGFLMGFAGSATFLVPLFVEESLGMSPRIGGVAIAGTGLASFVGRIAWARAAERSAHFGRSLGIIAVVSVAASLMYLGSSSLTSGLLIPAVFMMGVGSSSWNSVGMLAVMSEAGADLAGRASGVVMLGFLVGLSVGPPLFGATVDATSSYTSMWWISIAAFALAAILTALWRRSGTKT